MELTKFHLLSAFTTTTTNSDRFSISIQDLVVSQADERFV